MDGGGFYRTTQNGGQPKPYELFISGIFPLMRSHHCRSWITENVESLQVQGRGGGGRYSKEHIPRFIHAERYLRVTLLTFLVDSLSIGSQG